MWQYSDRFNKARGATDFGHHYQQGFNLDQCDLRLPRVDNLSSILSIFDSGFGPALSHSQKWQKVTYDPQALLRPQPDDPCQILCQQQIITALVDTILDTFEAARPELGFPAATIPSATVYRAYQAQPVGEKMQVWLLLSCSCLYQGEEKYLFFDLPLSDSHYLSSYPVLMSINGSVKQLGSGTVTTASCDFRALFSEAAFAELIQIAQNDFHDLPAKIIQDLLWKISIISQDSSAQLGFYNKLLDPDRAIFLVDTVASGHYTVRLFLNPFGEVQTEVERAYEY